MGSSVDAKLLRQTKFPPEFSKKVDMTKVNIEVMKKWIAGKLAELLGDEDDVVIELCFNLLESSRFPDIKSLQIQLTGFLDKDTPKFCQELWNLCLSAQSSPQGVPKELLEAKKLELKQEKLDAERAAEEARRRKELERERERELESIRQRERADRNKGFRGGRGGRDYDRRDSRSPRRRSPDRRGGPPRREFDSYVPRGGGRGRRHSRSYSRSISRSPSFSRSPPRRSYRSDRRDRRRPRSYSRSPSPDGRGYLRNRRRSPSYGDDRDRSAARSDSSRSPIPRRTRRRNTSSSRSRSRSPPPRTRRRRDRSPSRSRYKSASRTRSPSRSRSRRPRGGDRPKRSESIDSRDRAGRESKADIAIKNRYSKDDRRLSRSISPRRDSRSRSRSAASRRSQTRSPSLRSDRKRRRSLERYAPAGRRRRQSSADSPREEKRQRTAEPEDTKMHEDGSDAKQARSNPKSRLSANELRERVLKERIKAMRRRNCNDKTETIATNHRALYRGGGRRR